MEIEMGVSDTWVVPFNNFNYFPAILSDIKLD